MQNSDSPVNVLSNVWASVFLTACGLFGIAAIVFLTAVEPVLFDPVAVALLVAIAPGILNIPLMLTTREPDLGRLGMGQILVWLQAFALVVALILTIVIIVGGPL